MLKYGPYIIVLFLVSCIAACGGSSSSKPATPVTDYQIPKSFSSYSSLPTLRGGAVQWGPISTSAKFSDYSVSTVKHIAGIAGFSNYSTTNGPPAMFNHPTDITTDGANLYVTDYLNNLIRKIAPDGRITTLPILVLYPSGITTDGVNLYVSDTGNNRILIFNLLTEVVTTIGSATGLAGYVDSADNTAALFNQPLGITTDGKNLYVADFNNATVRWIDLTDTPYAVHTLAGAAITIGSDNGTQGSARFNRPAHITTDGRFVFMTDVYNRTIRQIEIKTGTVTTIAGSPGQLGHDAGTLDGNGTAARFYQPNGITTDGTYLYVTDSYQNTIRRIDKSAPYAVTTISGISGTGGVGGSVDSPGAPSFYTPIGITTDGTSLFVADTYNNTIRKIH